MPIHPEWSDIALRLLCTIVAGFLIGLDRGGHARPAGLRTTMLVALAACLAMLQVNLLLGQTGKHPDSFVSLDLMRLPLGILSGMGFIGAGAIVRRDNLVLGVTTAATLWFVTVEGLCFGGGQLMLGFAGLILGLIVLTGLRHFERRMKQDQQGTLTVITAADGPTEEDVRAILTVERYSIRSFAVVYSVESRHNKLVCRLNWRSRTTDTGVPEMVRLLSARPGVVRVAWVPQPA
jgi:putative Mg2+ transporter-C (MgtC) family protein